MFVIISSLLLVLADAPQLDPGTHTRQLTVDARARSYIVHVPSKPAAIERWPVVLAFHGGGTNAESMMRFSALNDKAESAGFVVVYPNGTGRAQRALTFNGGNCCGFAMRHEVDDVRFVAALLDDLAKQIPLDQGRVFATGMSNGAILCYALASQLSERIAAIAPVGGPMGTAACSPSRPVSVCHFHGTADAFAPYAGGRGRRSITKTNFFSVQHSIDNWVQANGCSKKPVQATLPARVDDGTSIRRDVYAGGKLGSAVVLYTIEGGGHTWPGEEPPMKWLGKSTKNLAANDVMWEFFQQHGR